jgi:hypothetical protein
MMSEQDMDTRVNAFEAMNIIAWNHIHILNKVKKDERT